MSEIELGDSVRDTVSGLIGVAVCETTWLHGCTRITIQPPLDKDGKVPGNYTVDKPQAVLVSKRGDDVPLRAPEDKKPCGDPSHEPKQR